MGAYRATPSFGAWEVDQARSKGFDNWGSTAISGLQTREAESKPICGPSSGTDKTLVDDGNDCEIWSKVNHPALKKLQTWIPIL